MNYLYRQLGLISQLSFAKDIDSLIYKQKSWYISAAVTRTFLSAPLLNWDGGNTNLYYVYPVTAYVGYRILPKIRAQIGVSYNTVKFNKITPSGWYIHYPYEYEADDKGQFLNIDFQLKGYALNQKYRLQPYLAIGTIARNYWLQQNHILYDSETKQEVDRINKRYNGTLLYGTINPGLQYRFLQSFEIFTEFNARFNLGTYNSIWPKGTTFFSGISGGLTYHLPNKK